jgi:hypothetical protein
MVYAWAVSLSMDSGLSEVLATYATDHFGSGEYDAWSAWDRNRPIQKDQAVTGVMVDFTSALYAHWQERFQIHRTQSHDLDVLALVPA